MSSGEHHKLGHTCSYMLTDKVRDHEHTGLLCSVFAALQSGVIAHSPEGMA